MNGSASLTIQFSLVPVLQKIAHHFHLYIPKVRTNQLELPFKHTLSTSVFSAAPEITMNWEIY